MAANPLDCPVCLNRYDCDCRSPRCLSCGHTLCTVCISLLVSTGRLTCPICRSAHFPNIGEANQVPINFTVLTLVEGASSNARLNVEMSEFARSKQNLQDASLIHRYRCQDQIEKLTIKKKAFEIKHQMLQSKLREIEEVQVGISSGLAHGDDHCQTLDAIMESVALAESQEQLRSTSELAQRCQNDIKLWVQTTRLLLSLGDDGDGELSLSNLALRVSKSDIGVWAKLNIQNKGDQWAQISLCEGRLLLHSLKADAPPPPEAEILSYQQVRLLIDNTNVTTFLSIQLPDSAQLDIVCVRLQGNADRTRQFQVMCSGERGPSYANTSLHDRDTDDYIGVWGGARNDGEVGALSGFEMGPRSDAPIVEGLVASFWMFPVERRPTHFKIYLQTAQNVDMSPVGQVISGLPTIKEAYKVENISHVHIVDCGTVLQDNC